MHVRGSRIGLEEILTFQRPVIVMLRKFIHKLPPHKRFLISGAMFCRSLKDADVYTYFDPEANSSSSVVLTPLPTPTAYTMTPLFFIPLEASESLVYACVVVCLPSVITKANYIKYLLVKQSYWNTIEVTFVGN